MCGIKVLKHLHVVLLLLLARIVFSLKWKRKEKKNPSKGKYTWKRVYKYIYGIVWCGM